MTCMEFIILKVSIGMILVLSLKTCRPEYLTDKGSIFDYNRFT